MAFIIALNCRPRCRFIEFGVTSALNGRIRCCVIPFDLTQASAEECRYENHNGQPNTLATLAFHLDASSTNSPPSQLCEPTSRHSADVCTILCVRRSVESRLRGRCS